MTADSPSSVVPKLRFQEFADEPAWECHPLSKLAKRLTQRNMDDADLRPLTNSAEHGVVDQREYFDKDIATNTDNYYIVEHGDYVYNPRVSSAAPVGPISKNRIGTGVMSPLYTVFRFRSEKNDFFAHYFRSSHWHGYLRRVSNTGARHDRMSITNDDLTRMPIPLPSLPEQQKIADCLDSLDDLIAAEGRKLEALRQYKQGLMQQLFPKPGETVPRLRFPEFEDAGDWEEKRLSSLVTLISGVHLAPDMYSTAGEVPYFTGPSDFTDEIQCAAKWTDESANTAKQHDTLITVKGSGVGEIWYLTLPAVAMGRQLMAVRTKFGDRRFMYQFLSTRRAQFEALASGNLIPGLSRGDILDMVACFPSRDEQQRIADCLTAIGDQVDAQARKIHALKLHKQGMLQQMFPSLEGQ